jgi:hypothetical protein
VVLDALQLGQHVDVNAVTDMMVLVPAMKRTGAAP